MADLNGFLYRSHKFGLILRKGFSTAGVAEGAFVTLYETKISVYKSGGKKIDSEGGGTSKREGTEEKKEGYLNDTSPRSLSPDSLRDSITKRKQKTRNNDLCYL